MLRMFWLGVLVGGAAAWLWRDEFRDGLVRRTRAARERAADALGAVEGAADLVLSRASQPLRQAEHVLHQTREMVGTGLRVGRERLRHHDAQV